MRDRHGRPRPQEILLLLFLLIARLSFAQSDTGGSIAGQISDSGGRLFPATVTLRNTATGSEDQALSDRNGNFRFAELAPGNYSVRVNAPGLAPWRTTNVTVEVGRVTRLTPTLSIAFVEPTARVQGAAPQADLSPSVSNNMSQQAVENLPSSSRNWSNFVLLSAGAAPDQNDAGGVSFRGLSPLMNNSTLDGADNNQAFLAHQRGATNGGYATSQAAVSEFQVNTSNFSSEYGRAAGGVINTVTKSGTNRLHGEAFFFDRNAAWGTTNGYTALTEQNSLGQYVSVPYRPLDTRKQWGIAAGGPIRRDKLFWFFAYDQSQRDFPGVARANEPQTFFAAPSAQTVETLAGRIGESPSAALTSYNNVLNQLSGLLGNVPRTARQTILFPKLDWQPNNRHHIGLQYNRMRRTAVNGVATQASDTYGIGSFGNGRSDVDAAIGRWEFFLTPNMLSDARYAYSRDRQAQLGSTPTAFEQQLAQNSLGLPPQVAVDRSSGFTFGTRSSLDKAAYPDETRQQFVDAITWIRGKHAIKLGFDYNYVTDVIEGMNNGAGAYSYSSVLNFVSDLLAPSHCDGTTTGVGKDPCYSYYEQTIGPASWKFETADYAAFLSDEWKITRRFTLSLGVRYEFQDLPKGNKLVANPDIPQAGVMPNDRNNFGPRAGFAWDIFGSGHTVLRAGYGIYYGRISNATVYSALTSTGAAIAQRNYYFRPLDTGAPPFPYVFSSNPVLTSTPDVIYFDKRFQNPQIEQAEVSLEQSLGHKTSITLTYMGSFGRELPNFIDTNIDLTSLGLLNYTIDDPQHLGPLHGSTYASKFFYQRINPQYNSITDITSETNSSYEAGVLRLTHPLTRALSVNVGYTFSHAIDDNQNEATFADNNDVYDPTDLKLERGTSNFDIRQRVSGGIVAHEPWRFSGFARTLLNGYTLAVAGEWRTGLPYTMRTTGAIPALACSYEEWLNAGGPNGGSNCAAINDPGVILGTAVSISGLGASLNGSGGDNRIPEVGRNTFRYPAISNLDLRAAKRTRLTERVSIEFLGEAFNILNHQNVTNIETIGYLIDNVATQTNSARLTYLSGTNGTAAFGGVTNANSTSLYRQRQIQVGCRLNF